MADAFAPKNDGGPAFTFTDYDGTTPRTVHGMSLRDYFAAQAMKGICTTMTPEIYEALAEGIIAGGPIAHVSYVLSDAMLKERAK